MANNILDGNIGVRVFTNYELEDDETPREIRQDMNEFGIDIEQTVMTDVNVNTSSGFEGDVLVGVDLLINGSHAPVILFNDIADSFNRAGVPVDDSDVIISSEKKPRQQNRPRLESNLAISEFDEDDPTNFIRIGESLTAKQLSEIENNFDKPAVFSLISRGKFADAVERVIGSVLDL